MTNIHASPPESPNYKTVNISTPSSNITPIWSPVKNPSPYDLPRNASPILSPCAGGSGGSGGGSTYNQSSSLYSHAPYNMSHGRNEYPQYSMPFQSTVGGGHSNHNTNDIMDFPNEYHPQQTGPWYSSM